VCEWVGRASYGQAACAEGGEKKGRRARKGKDRGERPNRAHMRVAGARQWASLARVPVGVLRGSLAPNFFMRCPPYDPILVTGMTHRFQGARVAQWVVHLGPGTEFGGDWTTHGGRKSCDKNSGVEKSIFWGRIHRVSVTSTLSTAQDESTCSACAQSNKAYLAVYYYLLLQLPYSSTPFYVCGRGGSEGSSLDGLAFKLTPSAGSALLCFKGPWPCHACVRGRDVH